MPFEEVCRLAKEMGFDPEWRSPAGAITWTSARPQQTPAYVADRRRIPGENDLICQALGAHLAGQCVGDLWDKRLNNFAPDAYKGKPEEIRAWAIEEMKFAAPEGG